MKKIAAITGILVFLLTNSAFIIQPQAAIQSDKVVSSLYGIPYGQLVKPERLNWIQKIVYKKAIKRLSLPTEEGQLKAKRKGDIAMGLAIATLVLFGIALLMNLSILVIASIVTGIAGLFTGIYAFTDIYARKAEKAKGIFAIVVGVGAVALLVLLALVLDFID